MPQAVSIGGILLDTQRIGLAVALCTALGLMRWLAPRFGTAPHRVERMGLVVLVTAALAARVAFVATQWPVFRDTPWTALYFWQEGYSPAVGVLAAAAVAGAVLITQRLRSVPASMGPAVLALAGPFAAYAALAAAPPSLLSSSGKAVRGAPVPDLRMETLTGTPVSLAELDGHPAVVNVWATWCLPCRREIPLLNETYRAHRNEGLRVVGVNRGESHGRIRDFLESTHIAYDVWADPESATAPAPSARLLERARSPGLPTTLFVDADGIVRRIKVGQLNPAVVRQALQLILRDAETVSSRPGTDKEPRTPRSRESA